jgi:ABC-type oligopeptide transport system substrate-binding subunit
MKVLAIAVGQDLQTNLGLKVSFRSTDWGRLLAALNAGIVPFVAMRWSADFLDAEDFLSDLLSSHSPGNQLEYSSAEFDRLCVAADGSMNTKERLRLYARAEDIALRDAPMVPICFEEDAELVSPHVKGLRATLVNYMPHSLVTVR